MMVDDQTVSLTGTFEFAASLSRSFALIVLEKKNDRFAHECNNEKSSESTRDIILRVKDGWTSDQLDKIMACMFAGSKEDTYNDAEVGHECEAPAIGPWSCSADRTKSTHIKATGKLEMLPNGGSCMHPKCLTIACILPDANKPEQQFHASSEFHLASPQPHENAVDHMKCNKANGKVVRQRRNRRDRGNSSRAQVLVQFLIDTYGLSYLKQGTGVIDIAGGSGELSFELSYMHGIPCTTIDPRQPKLSQQQLRQISFRKAWRELLFNAPIASPLCNHFLNTWLQVEPKYITGYLRGFDDKNGPRPDMSRERVAMHFLEFEDVDDGQIGSRAMPPKDAIASFISQGSVIVGMHPDQATGPIVDCADYFRKPWVIVPCCVFPQRYQFRRTCGHISSKTKCLCSAKQECTGVRNHGQFLEHLQNRSRFHAERTHLGFNGRNLALYSRGSIDTRIERLAHSMISNIFHIALPGTTARNVTDFRAQSNS